MHLFAVAAASADVSARLFRSHSLHFQINLNLILKTVVCYHFTESWLEESERTRIRTNTWWRGKRIWKEEIHLTVHQTPLTRFLSLELWMGSKEISSPRDLNQFEIIIISQKQTHMCNSIFKVILQAISTFMWACLIGGRTDGLNIESIETNYYCLLLLFNAFIQFVYLAFMHLMGWLKYKQFINMKIE